MGMLRLFLAYVVLIHHAPDGVLLHPLHPGIAVQCFYGISGFLIQLAIFNYRGTDDKRWYWRFYKSRVMRLFPTYYIMLVLTLLFLDAPAPSAYWRQGILPLLIYAWVNLTLIGQDILRIFLYDTATHQFTLLPPHIHNILPLINDHTYFAGAFTIIKQSWSLAVEVWFYLIAPFLLFRRSRWLVAVIAASSAFRFFLAAKGYAFHAYLDGIILSEITLFLCGSLAARFYLHFLASGKVEAQLQPFLKNNTSWVLKTFCTALFILLGYYYLSGWEQWPTEGDWLSDTYTVTGLKALAVPYRYWVVLIATILCLPWIFHLTSRWKWDRWIGDLSYPLYICHMFVIDLLSNATLNTQWKCVYITLASLALSVVLVYAVDRPVDKLRHRLYLRRKGAES